MNKFIIILIIFYSIIILFFNKGYIKYYPSINIYKNNIIEANEVKILSDNRFTDIFYII